MKTEKSTNKHNGKISLKEILAKEAAAQKLADAARGHLKAIKLEHKHARKAFKQAKKAAKRAHKEAKIAAKAWKAKMGKARSAPRARSNSATHGSPKAAKSGLATPLVAKPAFRQSKVGPQVMSVAAVAPGANGSDSVG